MRAPSARQSRASIENEIIRRRDRESQHEHLWGNQVQYYRQFDKSNHKFEEWTSPRYYETNNKLVEGIRKDKEKAELLEKRRERLRKMLEEEEKSYKIEVMVKSRDKFLGPPRRKFDDIPTEILRDLQLQNEQEEKERRMHEAELALYQQWRNSNPKVKEHERRLKTEELKLSWLDQQIERRMQKEQTEEECRRILQEREARFKEEEAKYKCLEEEARKKEEEYRQELKKQMEEIEEKRRVTEELQTAAEEDWKKLEAVRELQAKQDEEEKRRKACECALYNIRAHKQKLKRKALDVQEELRKEKALVDELVRSEALQRVEDKKKQLELHKTLTEFLEFQTQQQELEKQREKYLDFVFDSEAKMMYEKQDEVWKKERQARRQLLEEVFKTVSEQIREKLERNRERQEEVTRQREENLRRLEEYQEEIERLRRESQERTAEWKREVEVQVRQKSAAQRRLQAAERLSLDVELENVRKEEERLKRELMDMQRRRRPMVPVRSSLCLG